MTREERIELAKKRMTTDDTASTPSFKGAYTLPENFPKYTLRKGRNLIDIIPYRISNPENPACRQGFKVGDEDYLQVYHVHQGVGPDKHTYICPNRMYGKRCPICNAQKGMWETDREGAKKLYPKDRVIYNVIDLLEPDKGIQILDGSFAWYEKVLRELSALRATDGVPVLYGDREMGMSIEFYGMEESWNGHDFIKPDHFNFVERKAKYDESWLNIVCPIDTIFNIPSYEAMENDYYGVTDEVDDAPSFNQPTTQTESFEDAVNSDARTIGRVVEGANSLEDIIASEVPKTRRRREKKCELTCPFGHTCGKDFDSTDDCQKCDDEFYEKCGDLYDKM